MKIDWGIVGVIMFFISLFGVGVLLYLEDDYYGNSFCKRMGFDGVDRLNGGEYSPHHGKIHCSSSFLGEGLNKTFNVERDGLNLRFIDLEAQK